MRNITYIIFSFILIIAASGSSANACTQCEKTLRLSKLHWKCLASSLNSYISRVSNPVLINLVSCKKVSKKPNSEKIRKNSRIFLRPEEEKDQADPIIKVAPYKPGKPSGGPPYLDEFESMKTLSSNKDITISPRIAENVEDVSNLIFYMDKNQLNCLKDKIIKHIDAIDDPFEFKFEICG